MVHIVSILSHSIKTLNFLPANLRIQVQKERRNKLAKNRAEQPGVTKKKVNPYGGKGVAGVGNEQASFTDGSVADGDALYEPGSAHLVSGDSSTNP